MWCVLSLGPQDGASQRQGPGIVLDMEGRGKVRREACQWEKGFFTGQRREPNPALPALGSQQ